MNKAMLMLAGIATIVVLLVAAGVFGLVALWSGDRQDPDPAPVAAPSTAPERTTPPDTSTPPQSEEPTATPMDQIDGPDGVTIELADQDVDPETARDQAAAAVDYLTTRYTIDQSTPYPGLDYEHLEDLVAGPLAKATSYEVRDWKNPSSRALADYQDNPAWRQDITIDQIIASSNPDAAITIIYTLRNGSHGNMTAEPTHPTGFAFQRHDGHWLPSQTSRPQGT